MPGRNSVPANTLMFGQRHSLPLSSDTITPKAVAAAKKGVVHGVSGRLLVGLVQRRPDQGSRSQGLGARP